MRYTGVRALSGTISIGTLHNGAGGEEDRDDGDRNEAGHNHNKRCGDDAISENGDCRFGSALFAKYLLNRSGVSFAQMYPNMCLVQRQSILTELEVIK